MIGEHDSEMNMNSDPQARIHTERGYITNIDEIRAAEYPSLRSTTYLDHAGTTLYAKSLIDSFTQDLTRNLYGNPHSASASSQLSTRCVDDIRLQVLRFFNASPDEFDVVFTANATAAIKLVADVFRDCLDGFRYAYHVDSHTSVIGVRDLAMCGSKCVNDAQVQTWLNEALQTTESHSDLCLLAYPGQSNMTGRRVKQDWSKRARNLRECKHARIYTLLDAAGLVSTSALDLSDPTEAPDFVALSFYKIFGFPDVGALLVHKGAGDILRNRKYFGGGTVDMVTTSGSGWHRKRETSLHVQLEDGTLPFHSILALRSAFFVHSKIYGSMYNVSRHTDFLTCQTQKSLKKLRHSNGQHVCKIYGVQNETESDRGPVIAFNLYNNSGCYIPNSEVEKLAIVKGIQFRAGSLCNPGGIATYLDLSTEEMHRSYDAGQRCGSEHDVFNGKPTGVLRISFGAMSSLNDVTTFIEFIKEFYVDKTPIDYDVGSTKGLTEVTASPRFIIEGLSVFPIKSCAAFQVPTDMTWQVGPRGLAWDREWCLVHEGTFVALSQKRYPDMALLRPSIDLGQRQLRVMHDIRGSGARQISISLDSTTSLNCAVNTCEGVTSRRSNVCGESVEIEHYTSMEVSQFFTEALGVPCTLARFPSDGKIRQAQVRVPGLGTANDNTITGRSISLSNESPILLISRSSVNRLNEKIKEYGGVGKTIPADSFRGNITIAEEVDGGRCEHPYIEDTWSNIRIGGEKGLNFEVLGPCQRCQMVCIDQRNAKRNQEPFGTLVKTRRREGRVWFGMHVCLKTTGRCITGIRIGDEVIGFAKP